MFRSLQDHLQGVRQVYVVTLARLDVHPEDGPIRTETWSF
jgi:hypothetical protein